MANFIITGGSGFIGKHLSELLLKEQHTVTIFTTQKNYKASNPLLKAVYWNPKELFIDTEFSMQDCVVINLAGANVAGERWTDARKEELLDSRIQSLDTLHKAVVQNQLSIAHLVSASAIGFYGSGDKLFVEEDRGDQSFLSSICQQWEQAATNFTQLGISTSIARLGIVLGIEGGALKEFLKPLQFGIAGIPSSGKQIYSWIHIEDLCQLIYFLAKHKNVGTYNAVAPEPASVNAIFEVLIRVQKFFLFRVHAPSFFIKLLLGEMSIEVLKSAKVSSKKIEAAGFKFLYPNIEKAVF